MVITHTTAVSIYSLLLGPVADRWGNRLTLRVLILGAAIAPAYALVLPSLAGGLSRQWFWVVFIPLGLTPLVPTIVFNYTLELCGASEHPRYVSTVNLAMMPPFLLSPLVGTLVDTAGFPAVAIATCLVMLGCGVLTFWLEEPRRLAQRGRDA
jgi:MFS family permease